MISKEILAKIRNIEIKTGRLVNDIFAGQYNSVFKGRGMEFSEVREYAIGDDIRNIDWNVTARTGHPFIKIYNEERELTVMLLVDMSASLFFGTKNKFKSSIAAEISSVLAFSAIKNNDKVGMIIFTNKIEKVIPPKKGKRHILRLIREILYFEPTQRQTNINVALEYANEILKRKTVMFLVSDFECGGYERLMRITAKRHDLVNIVVQDPREYDIPDLGIIQIKDAETDEIIDINTSSAAFKKSLEARRILRKDDREKLFKKAGLDFVNIMTNESYIMPLMKFFKARERRFR